jgi:hypothetical protein
MTCYHPPRDQQSQLLRQSRGDGMTTYYFVDWVPFASPAIQTSPISAGNVDLKQLRKTVTLDWRGRIEEIAYCLRLDGIYLFAIRYADNEHPSKGNNLYWDAKKISVFLRNQIFGFEFLPAFQHKAYWIYHAPTGMEDLAAPEYNNHCAKAGVTLTPPAYIDATTPPLQALLTTIANNDAALCLARRLTNHKLRRDHFACLHLKSSMGRQRNEIEQMIQDQIRYEASNRGLRGAITMTLGAMLIIMAIVLVPFLVYEIATSGGIGIRSVAAEIWGSLRQAPAPYLVAAFILMIGFGMLRVPYWWYEKSYKKRSFIFTNGLIYFANCCQFGASVSKLYEKVGSAALVRAAVGRDFYSHSRSFEGTIEDLKARLQNEQTKVRDTGIRYAVAFAVISFLARMIADIPSTRSPAAVTSAPVAVVAQSA